MKVPLAYPKIPDTSGCPLKKCWVFEKYDGTNMHWDYDHGFKTFGTRRDSFPYNAEGFKSFAEAHPGLEQALQVFDAISTDLGEFLFTYHSGIKFTVFTEYLGPNSFAGQHKPDDPMRHVIIDVMKGSKFLSPEQFIEMFEGDWPLKFGWKPNFEHAKLVYQGKYSGQLVEDIRNGKLSVNEGAVIKGVHDKQVYMAKVKTNVYLEKLKSVFQDKWEEYWE